MLAWASRKRMLERYPHAYTWEASPWWMFDRRWTLDCTEYHEHEGERAVAAPVLHLQPTRVLTQRKTPASVPEKRNTALLAHEVATALRMGGNVVLTVNGPAIIMPQGAHEAEHSAREAGQAHVKRAGGGITRRGSRPQMAQGGRGVGGGVDTGKPRPGSCSCDVRNSQPLNQWVEIRRYEGNKGTPCRAAPRTKSRTRCRPEEHHAKQEELIETLALKYGRTEEYMRTLVCNGAKYGNKRGVNTKNAILHEYCNKAREEGGPSNVRDVQDEMSGEEYKRIKDSLSKEDLARLRAQLKEHRDTKHHGVRATNKSCQLDAVQTQTALLRNLHLRTGVAAFAIFTRGNPDDAAKPHIVDSDDASRFFIDVLKMSPLMLSARWSSGPVRDTMDVDANTADAVRSQITDMANDGLRKIKNKQKLVMEWSNFRLKMVHELGVEMAGWPSNIEIKPPSKLCADDARRIRDLMRTGAIHWVTLTASQRARSRKRLRRARCRDFKEAQAVQRQGSPARPRAKKSAATKGTEGEAGARLPHRVLATVLAQAPSNGIQAAIALSPALGLTEVGAPASSLVASPGSVAAPASSPTAAVTATEASGASSVPVLGSVAAPATSPVAAGIATEASGASSVPALGSVAAPPHLPSLPVSPPPHLRRCRSAPAFGGGVSTGTVGLDAAFGPGFDLNFDFTFLDHPSFAHQLPAEEEVLRLNTSNLDHETGASGRRGVPGCAGATQCEHGHHCLHLLYLRLLCSDKYHGQQKRKRSGNDGGEKRPRKTRSDKDKPRGPRKSTTNTATATPPREAAAEAAPALLNAPPYLCLKSH
ncbi:hypothetical protein B0H14DRAFT_2571153 [Mycena olivaceomarginata]|nr:hypothetical protein B0H14DRAFT_2571153 [Mycena olivaceomarginata]